MFFYHLDQIQNRRLKVGESQLLFRSPLSQRHTRIHKQTNLLHQEIHIKLEIQLHKYLETTKKLQEWDTDLTLDFLICMTIERKCYKQYALLLKWLKTAYPLGIGKPLLQLYSGTEVEHSSLSFTTLSSPDGLAFKSIFVFSHSPSPNAKVRNRDARAAKLTVQTNLRLSTDPIRFDRRRKIEKEGWKQIQIFQ